jgi:hypothetical protein
MTSPFCLTASLPCGPLANNPFSMLISRFRVVLSNGDLGVFQGGTEVPRRLLQRGGVITSPAGQMTTDRAYY